MARSLRLALLFLASLVAACGGPETLPPEEEQVPAPPSRVGKGDGLFEVTGLSGFYLAGNDLTNGQDLAKVRVVAPESVRRIWVWLDGGPGIRLRKRGNVFTASIPLADLEPGEHELLLAADGAEEAFAKHVFVRTHPLYVVVSTDWDDPDNEEPTLRRQEYLHERHVELKITHFVGPYTFTDPGVSEERRAELAAWVRGMEEQHGDEIGVHIHPYCSFVESAGLTCRTSPSFARSWPDRTGYTVVLSSYPEEEMKTLADHAVELFAQRDLGRPTSFRAGGWTAELHTLKALAAAGYVVDASGCNWHRLEEWKDYPGADLYRWNETHWSSIDELSQPYWPSETDLLVSEAPHLPILEAPDNGLLVDYVAAEEMIDVFHRNWPGGALERPTVLSIGYHPPNFSEEYKLRIDGALSEVDRFLASEGQGPVVYATMSDLTRVFPRP